MLSILILLVSLGVLPALAQQHSPAMPPHNPCAPPAGHDMGPGGHTTQTHQLHQQMGAAHHGGMPILPGQDAFGAIQEIISILEADPNTDWSKVNIQALRDHLADMNLVTLKAEVKGEYTPQGAEFTISGQGRTRDAIQRMVLAHAPEVAKMGKWKAQAERTKTGARLTVSADDPKEIQKIRALGFFGFMAASNHHQPHHLAMARGGSPHGH